jgi:MFS family permease
VVAIVVSEVVEGWHIVVLSMLFGIPHTLDMAARRTFALDLVGREGLPYANALESLSMTAAGMVGPFIAGALIAVAPLGKADAAAPYIFITAIYLVAFVVLLRIRSMPTHARPPLQVRSAFTAVADGARAVAGNHAVIGALGIVVIMNLMYYSYIPLVPVFADKVLGVGPTLLGVLGSAQGFGAFISTIFIATRRKISRSSTYYVTGTLIAFTGLLAFSLSRVYSLSVAALVVAGMGMSGFLTMLFTLVLLSVQEDMRGRVMGFVNLAIGVSPVSMLLLGWMAGSFGPGLAVTISSSLGLALTTLWSYKAREMRKL